MERMVTDCRGSQDGSYEIYIPGIVDSDEARWKCNTWEEEILSDLRFPGDLPKPSPITIPVVTITTIQGDTGRNLLSHY